MRYIILVAALLATPAMGEVQPSTCIAVELNVGGAAVPEKVDHDRMALLDMRGHWAVSSWANVEWSAQSAPDRFSRCVAQELMAARASVARNVTPDLTCPPARNAEGVFGAWAWSQVQHLIDTDPIMRACQPATRCDPGETCS